jgi:AcrR family transcriptional regulator
VSRNSGRNQSDLRVRRTQKHLRDALIALSLERGYAAVTVADLTERAMVNRSTFYLHYQDKYDLVVQCLEAMLLEVPSLQIDELFATRPGEAISSAVCFFEHLAQHRDFYAAMLGTGGMPSFASHLRSIIENDVRANSPTRAAPMTLIPVFVAQGVVSTAVWWLEQTNDITPRQVATWYTSLIVPGVRALLEAQSVPQKS